MTNQELKRAVLAALIGAAITFLTHMLESLTGSGGNYTDSVLGGVSATVAYLKLSTRIL